MRPGAGRATALAAISTDQPPLLYVEDRFGLDLPFMVSGAAQGATFVTFAGTRAFEG